MLTDLRLGARLLLKDRWFTAAAVLVLGLGIAVTNTAFTIVNGVLLRDMPFAEADRLVQLTDLSYPELRDARGALTTFEDIGGAWEQPANVADDDGPAERSRVAFVSAHAFRLLRQPVLLGRDLVAGDERVGAAPVVVLSHPLWRTRYRADAAVIGRTIRINGAAATVIGVMPPGFEFPTNARLWQPLSLLPTDLRDDRQLRFGAFARLTAAATMPQARAELAAVLGGLQRTGPDDQGRLPVTVEPFRSGIGGPIVVLMAALMAAVTFVLLIACANVANLLLARAARRSREVSVRMALGAGRWRIVRQLLAESVLLAALGGAVGLAASAAGVRLFWNVVSQVGDPPPFWMSFPLDARVFGFLALVCLGTAIVFGLAPALHTSRTNIVELLGDGGSRSGTARRGRRWAGGLVVAQVGLALVLLAASGIMMRHLVTLVTMDAGVDTSRLVAMSIDLPARSYPTARERREFYRQLDERLAGLAAVQGAMASAVPMGGAPETRILPDDRPDLPMNLRPTASLVRIGPRYFETIGNLPARVLPGPGDTAAPASVIVNERFATLTFPDGAIGHRVRLGADSEWSTIVGVVPDVRQRTMASGAFDAVIYVPVDHDPPARITVLARAAVGAAAVAAAVREHVAALNADLPVYDLRTVDEGLAIARWPQRVFGSLFVIFAAVALVLAAIGLYAVTAYSVAQRTAEIGVRVALGAKPAQVLRLVMHRSLVQLAIGLVIGVAGAIGVSRILPAIVAGAGGADPVTLLVVAALLTGVAVTATWLPARRALRLNPVSALRME